MLLMREILFRGKGIDTEEWFEGWYLEACFGSWPLRPSIVPHIDAREGYHRAVEINKDTLGQYTGLTDKNGKKIFEGDIVRHYNVTTDIECKDLFDTGVVYFDDEALGFRRTTNEVFHKGAVKSYRMSPECIYEVIGNIHDTPELQRREDNY